ncbi:hypothetical protein KZX46_03485 (plasmid) [Polymorphobacter sp. PAMC 29334]|uniref:hypothetical protein n=1 Tax=Polymorphobacter sp. PAMC 29334 TaxID=2862331 RepID=UPI001C784A82|nr:hypothetical protein [Polymorphobacter sp. PAMC 29334]QYE33186.1 hypothetical protein KZX46_03485 [Polymorphobacter sp. PAMC 29334]
MSFFDDEGALMVGFRSLLEGHRMYDEIYSLYGPLYNGIYRIIYVTLRIPLTHTVGRTIAALLWISYSAAFAMLCFQITASRIAAVLCYSLTLVWLKELMNSPGHPEEISLLIVAFLLLTTGSLGSPDTRRSARVATAMYVGGLIAGLVLVKINLGLLAGECLIILLLRLTAPSGYVRAGILLMTALVLLTPALLAIQLIGQSWVIIYVGFATLTLVATLTVFHKINMPIVITCYDWLGLMVGGLTVAFVIIGSTLLTGTSAYALLNAVVLQNTHFVQNWFIPMRIGLAGGVAAVLSLGLALAYTLGVKRAERTSRSSHRELVYLAIYSTKAAFLLAGIVLFRSPGMFFQVLVPFGWLLIAGLANVSPRAMILRGALALMGALLVFYPFPVAGHQIDIGALAIVIALSVIGYDVMAFAWQQIGGSGLMNVGRWGLLVSGGLVLVLNGAHITVRDGREYLSNTPLALRGTYLIRLPANQVESLHWVTRKLQACRSSYSLPGLLSFAFWTGQTLPTSLNINDVLGFIRPDQQKVIVQALRRSPDLCIVESDKLLHYLDRGQIARDPPLLHYIRSDFAAVSSHGSYTILERRLPDATYFPK